MSTQHFDLTTEQGRQNALEAFDKHGWIINWPVWLMRHAYKAMTEGGATTVKAQKDAAVEIIKAGKDNNVDKMTITMDRTAGLDLGSDIEGIPIKLKIGDSGKVSIEVQYRA